MIRLLYRSLVRLHPPLFRREFGEEMLAIFDQASQTEGPVALCADAVVSLGRQWLLRTGCWKVAAAVALALFQTMLVGLTLDVFRPRLFAAAATRTSFAHQTVTVPMLVGLALAILVGLLLFTMGLNHWVKCCNARRRPVSLKVR